MPASNTTPDRAVSSAVASFLGQHYGDRSVYLRDEGDRPLLEAAQAQGLVTSDGQLTNAGYAFWQRHRTT